uniref:Uncharacterized protein n=1 Tax=viral metagenome TaxID=1070528 RepID=A0A6C0DTL7_9ZZZZ
MDSTAIFLAFIIILLLGIIIYVAFNPTYEFTYSGRRPHYRPPHPVMPQYGPYWSHGGQTNSGLLY